MEETEKTEIIVKCADNCSCMSIDKWSDDSDYYVTFYKSYQTKSLWFRIKDALNILRGKDVVGTDIVLKPEDFTKLKNFF
jgi:hypothetical protein